MSNDEQHILHQRFYLKIGAIHYSSNQLLMLRTITPKVLNLDNPVRSAG
jgi:hypothetical protein